MKKSEKDFSEQNKTNAFCRFDIDKERFYVIITTLFSQRRGVTQFGRVLGLGACRAFNVLKNKKPQNPCIHAGFGHL